MKTVAFHTLGCKVNQVETEQLKEDFLRCGYRTVDFNQPADVYVINTCTVTHVSDRKSRAMIRRAARTNPQAIVAAVGCLAQTDPEQLAQIEGLNLVVGNACKQDLANIIDSWADDNMDGVKVMAGDITCEDRPGPIIYTQHHKRTRAFVKIEDGCESFCSYCIVPYARGPVRSKLPENVLNEFKQLLLLGYREIVLTGINTGFYGKDLTGWNLVGLLKYLLENLPGNFRIRLSSIEPLEINDQLINLAVTDKHICRHFHIPLQSGSDRILKLMNRRYSRSGYRELIGEIIRQIPNTAITTDIMVGFPDETENDFASTYELIDSLPLCDLHVFKYSRRPGTPAADYSRQLSEIEKQKRSELLITLAAKKKEEFLQQMIGQKLTVLIEKKINNRTFTGISDNYINVNVSGETLLPGNFADLLITGIVDGTATGNFV